MRWAAMAVTAALVVAAVLDAFNAYRRANHWSAILVTPQPYTALTRVIAGVLLVAGVGLMLSGLSPVLEPAVWASGAVLVVAYELVLR